MKRVLWAALACFLTTGSDFAAAAIHKIGNNPNREDNLLIVPMDGQEPGAGGIPWTINLSLLPVAQPILPEYGNPALPGVRTPDFSQFQQVPPPAAQFRQVPPSVAHYGVSNEGTSLLVGMTYRWGLVNGTLSRHDDKPFVFDDSKFLGVWNSGALPAAAAGNAGKAYRVGSTVQPGHGFANVPNVLLVPGDYLCSDGTVWKKIGPVPDIVIETYSIGGPWTSPAITAIRIPHPKAFSYDDGTEWAAFEAAGHKLVKETTPPGAGGSVLTTTVEFADPLTVRAAWGFDTTHAFVGLPSGEFRPIVISHKGLSGEYYHLVRVRGGFSKVVTETVSGSQRPRQFPMFLQEGPGATPALTQECGQPVPAAVPAYALSFSTPPPFVSKLTQMPQFQGQPLPPAYLGKTLEEIRAVGSAGPNFDVPALATATTSGWKDLDDTPELLKHPLLDRLALDLQKNPVAIANFVLNHIDLTDATQPSTLETAAGGYLDAPGVDRNALSVYLERQGSPTEQCALLVYLLRASNIEAAYIFPKYLDAATPTGLRLLDIDANRLLRADVSSAAGKKTPLQDSPRSLVTCYYPWVVAKIDGVWRHLFPWMKDYEVTDGFDFWPLLPDSCNTPYRWMKSYVGPTSLGDPLSPPANSPDLWGDTAREEPLKGLLRMFSWKNPKISLHEVGYSTRLRRHYHSSWGSFPHPWSLMSPANTDLVKDFEDKPSLFNLVTIKVKSTANPGTRQYTISNLRVSDLSNRNLTIRTEEQQTPTMVAATDFVDEYTFGGFGTPGSVGWMASTGNGDIFSPDTKYSWHGICTATVQGPSSLRFKMGVTSSPSGSATIKFSLNGVLVYTRNQSQGELSITDLLLPNGSNTLTWEASKSGSSNGPVFNFHATVREAQFRSLTGDKLVVELDPLRTGQNAGVFTGSMKGRQLLNTVVLPRSNWDNVEDEFFTASESFVEDRVSRGIAWNGISTPGDDCSITRGSTVSGFCSVGRVTPDMLTFQHSRLMEDEATSAIQNDPNEKARRREAFMAHTLGLNYLRSISEADREMCRLNKLVPVGSKYSLFTGFHGIKDAAGNRVSHPCIDHFSLGTNVTFRGLLSPRYTTFGMLKFDANGNLVNVDDRRHAIGCMIFNDSALEHINVNMLFPELSGDLGGYSAVELLNIARRARVTNSANPKIIELRSGADRSSQGELTVTGGQKLKDTAGPGIWDVVAELLPDGHPDDGTQWFFLTPGKVPTVSGNAFGSLGVDWGGSLISLPSHGGFADAIPYLTQVAKINGITIRIDDDGSIRCYGPPAVGEAAQLDDLILIKVIQEAMKKILSGDLAAKPDDLRQFIMDFYNEKVPGSTGFLDPNYRTRAMPELLLNRWDFPRGPNESVADMLKRRAEQGLSETPTFPYPIGYPIQIADPVDVVTGAFYVHEADITLPGPMPFVLIRNYSSLNVAPGNLGYGWKLGFDPALVVAYDPAVTAITDSTPPLYLQVPEQDGSIVQYRWVSGTEEWRPTSDDNPSMTNGANGHVGGVWNPFSSKLVRTFEGSGSTLKTIFTLYASDGSQRRYEIRKFSKTGSANGTSWSFNMRRPLLRLWKDSAGNEMTFSYFNDDGEATAVGDLAFTLLRRVQASNGNSLVFYYNDRGFISEVATGDGRRIRYEYGFYGDLTKVILPDGSETKYHYILEKVNLEASEINLTGVQEYSTHLIWKEEKPNGRYIINKYETEIRDGATFHQSDIDFAGSAAWLPDPVTENSPKVVLRPRVTMQWAPAGTGPTVLPEPWNKESEDSEAPVRVARFDWSHQTEKINPDGTITGKFDGYTKVIDAYGRPMTYEYTDSRITRVIEASGHFTEQTWYPSTDPATGAFKGNLKSELSAQGRLTTYFYDANGNVIETRLQGELDGVPGIDTVQTLTKYDPALNVVTETWLPDPLTGKARADRASTQPGILATDVYSGRKVVVTYGDSNYPRLSTATRFFGPGNVLISTQQKEWGGAGTPAGVGQPFQPFSRGLLMRQTEGRESPGATDMDFTEVVYTYQANGFPATELRKSGTTDPDVQYDYTYNLRQEMLDRTDPSGTKLVYGYDDMGRQIWEEILSPAGAQVSWRYSYYNENGELEWTDGSRSGAAEDYTWQGYDLMGRPVETVAWRSRAKSDGTGVEQIPGDGRYAVSFKRYNLLNDLILSVDPLERTTRTKYDAFGRVVQQLQFKSLLSVDVLSSTSVSYEDLPVTAMPPAPENLVLTRQRTVTSVDPLGAQTQSRPTDGGRPVFAQSSLGTQKTWTYYLDGRARREPVDHWFSWEYTYEDGPVAGPPVTGAFGRVTKSLKGNGTLIRSEWIWTDRLGREVCAIDSAGNQWITKYDRMGRIVEKRGPPTSGLSEQQITTCRYPDPSGRQTVVINGAGEAGFTKRDALNRPEENTVWAAGTWALTGNAATGFLQPSGAAGPVTKTTLEYDSQRHWILTREGTGVAGSPQLATKVWSDTGGQAVLKQRLNAASGAVVAWESSAFDAAGQLTSLRPESGDAFTSIFGYDGLGRPNLTRYPGGEEIRTQYAFFPILDQRNLNLAEERPSLGEYGQVVRQKMADGLVNVSATDKHGRPLISYLVRNDKTPPESTALEEVSREMKEYLYYTAGDSARDNGRQKSYRDGRGVLHSSQYDERGRLETSTSDNGARITKTFTYDTLDRATVIVESKGGAALTWVFRDWDAYGQLIRETTGYQSNYPDLPVFGVMLPPFSSTVENKYNAAGRRIEMAALQNPGAQTLPASAWNSRPGHWNFGWRADGRMASAATGGVGYSYSWSNNGALLSRSGAITSTIPVRDELGRIKQRDTSAPGGVTLTESISSWLPGDRQGDYNVTLTTPAGAFSDNRIYTYDSARLRLASEAFKGADGVTRTQSYTFDHGRTDGLGVLTGRGLTGDSAAPMSITSGSGVISGSVRQQTNTREPRYIPTTGNAVGAGSVVLASNPRFSGPAGIFDSPFSKPPLKTAFAGPFDATGNWSGVFRTVPGAYKLSAKAVHPSGQAQVESSSLFQVSPVAAAMSAAASTLIQDGEGNVTRRGLQTLTWDVLGRLVAVEETDPATSTGYKWSAIYDALDRRIQTGVTVTGTGATTDAHIESSIFDPLVEFLEIGLQVTPRGAAAPRMFWKLHGPDLNGAYGGMQGTGGLEAVLEEIASPPGVTVEHTLRDFYGHHLRPADGLASQSLGYGPKPGAPARTIFEGASPAEAAGWRGRRADITGAVWLGARYYQPEDGRFLSADPAGHAASRSLYDYAGGDPVNSFDPDGRLWTTRLTESSSTQQFKAYTSGLLAWSMGDGTIALGVKMTHGMMTVKAAYGLQSDSDMILAPTILSGGIISEQALLEALRNGDLSQIIDQATKTATQGIHAFGIAGYMEKERALPDAVDHMVHGAGSALANGDYWGAAWRAGATALEWLSGAELARGASALFKMAQFEGRAACIVSGMVGYGGANVLAQGMVGVVSNEEFDWEEVKWSAATGGILHAIFGTCFLGDTPVATASGPRRIDSLRVGERVLAAGAENVESSVNPETWRHITLEMPNPLCPNDDTLHIEVLRGPEWIRALNAKPGAWIRFTLEEMGLDGWAQVTGIGPCPSIQNGVGRVVLATVNHLNSRVMELNIAGSSQPLHPTNSHLLFSATRNTWVPAEELLPGESLKTFTGVARAEKGSFLPGTYNVFNIEVEAAHCYFTGDVQILSHNACVNASTAGRTPEEIQSMIEYAKLTNGYLDKYGPQIIQSTKGALRLEASADAAAARRAAERAGQPFMGQAGHVPDTAITGMASPPLGYLDMAGKSNSAMGGLLGSRVGQQLDAILIDGVKY